MSSCRTSPFWVKKLRYEEGRAGVEKGIRLISSAYVAGTERQGGWTVKRRGHAVGAAPSDKYRAPTPTTGPRKLRSTRQSGHGAGAGCLKQCGNDLVSRQKNIMKQAGPNLHNLELPMLMPGIKGSITRPTGLLPESSRWQLMRWGRPPAGVALRRK